jgi:nicotinamidase-related amidase
MRYPSDGSDDVTTLENRPNTALLVVDAQRQVMSDVHDRDRVVANVGRLVSSAREAQVPVVWVQDSLDGESRGSEKWQIVPELEPRDDEPRVEKDYPDSFEETSLEQVFAQLKVGRVIVCGAQTDECIRSTLHGAITRGYDTTLVSDAHTTEDFTEWGAPPPDQIITLTNLYWGGHTAPGRTAGAVATNDVTFG